MPDGQILKVTPEGDASILAQLPPGAFAGVIALAPEGDLYLTVMAPKKPEHHGVWRFTPDGQGEPLATLPPETGPNGLTFGPDGRLYMADANLGAIWRIEPDTGQATQWFQDALLRKRPFVGLFPGANGLKFWDGDLYVSVSDKGHIVRIPLQVGHRPDEPVVYATGVPTDDFAFDRDGNLYATTHPFNTIVRITPDGEQTIIATESEGVIGPTEVAFGTLPGDETTLYVATDGGLFEGRAEQRPNIVKLEVGVPGLVEK